MATLVLVLDPRHHARLRAAFEAAGWRIEARPHASFLARGSDATVTAYESGKVLVTGPNAAAAARFVEREGGAVAGVGPREAPAPPAVAAGPRIGSDESGKGDYFGPLAVAAVAVVDEAGEAALRRAGVKDSKVVPDGALGRMADAIEEALDFEVAVLPPEEYAAAHAEAGNLNVLLARLHADLIRKLAARTSARRVVVDRFAQRAAVTEELGRGFPLPVEERPRAEDDPAVAAASVVARRRFLLGLSVLSEEMGIPLPKGAGPPAVSAARVVVAKWGEEGLARCAKTHFAMRR